MKKIVSLTLVIVMLVCVLASCGNISESYAKKINEAAANKEHYTYSQVIKDLGGKEEVADLTISVPVVGASGTVIAVKGCSSWDDIKAKIDAGETVKGIVVVIAADKAISAEYREISTSDNK
jgi:hypothetical protein